MCQTSRFLNAMQLLAISYDGEMEWPWLYRPWKGNQGKKRDRDRRLDVHLEIVLNVVVITRANKGCE